MDINRFYGRRKSKTVPVNDSNESESELQHTVKFSFWWEPLCRV